MGFTFAARTLLELGKELISSDEVALYELIKNAVDAQQDVPFTDRRVAIRTQVVLLKSHLGHAMDMLANQAPPQEVLETLQSQILEDAPAAAVKRFLQPLIASVNDPEGFTEKLHWSYANENWLEVSDTGHGMSLDELRHVFLRVGTRSRRANNLKGAQYLGDKGVGRLSAMRLGDVLQVTTSRAGEHRWNLLKIDWSRFSHDEDLDAGEVTLAPTLGEPKPTPGEHGTTIRVSGLTAEWDRIRFQQMLEGRIARMVDPFQPGRANRLLTVQHNGKRLLVPSIPRVLLDAAHATCEVAFHFEKGEPVLEGKIDYRLRQRQRVIEARGAEIYSLAQTPASRRGKRGQAATQLRPISRSALERLGPFTCEIYWYNRRVVESVHSLSETAAETRRLIAKWSGGPMLYRYDFRVLPYGDPDDDWLGLDEAAFGQSGFKLNRQQVIGRISINSPHTALSEQTNREGLIQSEAADALRRILMWLMQVEMRSLINEADRIETMNRREASSDANSLHKKRDQIQRTLTELKEVVDDKNTELVRQLSKDVEELTIYANQLISRLDKVVGEAEDEREKFVYLAGVGLMTEFIFHELERSVTHTLAVLSHARKSTQEDVLDSLAEQLKTLNKRIAAFDELSGEKRQSRTTFDMRDLVRTVLAAHANEFDRHSIIVHYNPPTTPMPVRAVRGMILQILENLLTNSSYWLKQQRNYEESFQPRLWIILDPEHKRLTVEDNGPGVPIDRMEQIFQPFVTSKPAGQGRGLGLYISRELASQHKWKLFMEPTPGRIRPGRTNSFVLDMWES